MRIALVTTFPPGTGSLNEYAYHFVEALRRKPEVQEVLLLVDELPDSDTEGAYVDLPGGPGKAPVRFAPCWRFDGWDNPLRIAQAVRRERPDAVLFNVQFASFGAGKIPATLGLLTPLLLKAMGLPTLVLLHNIMETVDLQNAGYAANPLVAWIIRLFGTLVTWLVLQADRVMLTIPKYVEILREKYGADNVLLTPHGNWDAVGHPPQGTETPEHVGPPSDTPLPDTPLQVMTFGKRWEIEMAKF